MTNDTFLTVEQREKMSNKELDVLLHNEVCRLVAKVADPERRARLLAMNNGIRLRLQAKAAKLKNRIHDDDPEKEVKIAMALAEQVGVEMMDSFNQLKDLLDHAQQ